MASHLIAGSTALVVFETVAASSIQARVVSLSLSSLTPPSLVGSEVTVATQPGFDEYRPAVSRHEGAAGNYLVVWERGRDGIWRIAYDVWHGPAED